MTDTTNRPLAEEYLVAVAALDKIIESPVTLHHEHAVLTIIRDTLLAMHQAWTSA